MLQFLRFFQTFNEITADFLYRYLDIM